MRIMYVKFSLKLVKKINMYSAGINKKTNYQLCERRQAVNMLFRGETV